MLFKFFFNILKNLRWVITLVLILGGLYLAVTQYQAIKATPLGALLPSITIPSVSQVLEQATQTPSVTPTTVQPTSIPTQLKVTISTPQGEVTYLSETAITEAARAQGLMYRTNLPQYAGMYFIFEKEVQYGFWMKNCEIPLDMLFIDSQKTIVDIKENIRPCKETNPKQEVCPSYVPKVAYLTVLEINGGSSKLNHLSIGQKVTERN